MGKLLRALALPALLCAGVWLVVIIYWQQIHLMPTAVDIGLYLLALPLLLFLSVLALRGLWHRRRARLQAPVLAGDAAVPVAAPAAPTSQLLAAAVLTPLGDSWAEILKASQAEPVPQLDPHLLDQHGFPLPARRRAELELDTAWPPASLPEAGDESQRRELALLAATLDQLAPSLQMLAIALQQAQPVRRPSRHISELNPAWHGEASPAVPPPSAIHTLPAGLQVQLLHAPHHDPAPMLALLQQGLAGMGFAASQLRCEARATTVEQVAGQVDQIQAATAAAPAPTVLLLLAASSSICQQRLDAGWLAEQAAESHGLYFPGEVAAGLLLANAEVQLAELPPLGRLGPARCCACEPGDLSRPHQSALLSSLLADMAGDRDPDEQAAWLFTGLGLGGEAVEAAVLLNAQAGGVQIDEVLHLRAAIGDAGLAATLAAYALAGQMLPALGKPTLLVMNDGVKRRGICRLEPVLAS